MQQIPNPPKKLGIGFCGAHRTGKTTLARAYAETQGYYFYETSVSKTAARMNIDVSKPMSWFDRMALQIQLLQEFFADYSDLSSYGRPWVCDRTPLDFAMYTLYDAMYTPLVNYAELENYLLTCYSLTDTFLTHTIRVPPGINLVPAEGKAALDETLIDMLDSLLFSTMYNAQLQSVNKVHIPDGTLDLADRVKFVISSLSKGVDNLSTEAISVVRHLRVVK